MIKHDLADLFRKNSIYKKLVINYDGGTITNSDLLMEEFSLEESICSEEELRFGSCEASVIRFPISNVFTSLNGKVLDVSVVLDHNEDKPLKIGKYKVASDIPTADRKRKDITAYDALYDVINSDVADWYNALLPNNDSTVTSKQFRDSFFGYFGIEQVEVSLINDSMIVTKTIQPTELSGSMVANAICELNGCFGHINRDGLMDYVFLKGFTESIYPSDDLYPADDLFPSEANYHKYTKSDYPSGGCDYQEYVVRKITGLEIRQEEDSAGVFVGERENPYVVSDNFLTYGKSTEEMTTIAQNMFNVINGIEYRPFTLNTFHGNPCVEVGDGIKIYTDNQIIESYVLNRTLTGIQALNDDFETNGREYRSAQINSVEKSIIQLRGKTNILERTIDETRSEITKKNAETLEAAKLDTDEKLKSYSTTSEMRSEISQSAEAINLSVSEQIKETKKYTDTSLEDYSTTTEMNSAISLSAQGITQEVSKTYATKTETQNLSTRVEQTADMIAIGIDANGNLVTDLTLDKNGMTFVGNYLVVSAENFELNEDGEVMIRGIAYLDNGLSIYIPEYTKVNGYKFDAGYYNVATAGKNSVKMGVLDSGDGTSTYMDFDREGFVTLVANGQRIFHANEYGTYGTLFFDVPIGGDKGIIGKISCTDMVGRYSIGTSDSDANYQVAYINSKAPVNETYHITVTGKWESDTYSAHNIVSASSDIRLKENIKPTKVENALDIINKFGIYEFDWKERGTHQKIGFIADYLQEVDERLAVGGGYEEDGMPNYKTVDSFYMQGYIVKAIQELSAENKELKSEIDELKKSVSFLMEKLGGMENE